MQIFSKNIDKNKIPLWLMRQAGRYLPEYQVIRKSVADFFDLCYNPQKAAIVTLQPINRFNFDAAIIFSDILVLPHSLGWEVRFVENIGPILKKFTSYEDLNILTKSNINKGNINKVYEAISLVKAQLPKNVSLIGFAGAPWTVISYMLSGKSKHDFQEVKNFLYKNTILVKNLVEFFTEQTIFYLIGQIKAGADVVKIFDSWSGVLTEREYDEFVIEPTKVIVQSIKKIFPNIPIIGFPKGSGFWYEKYIDNTGIDCIAIDHLVPVHIMQKWQQKIVVQGNLDPVVLLTNKECIKEKLDNILNVVTPENFIFNLGHGVLPITPLENIEFLVKYVRNFKK